DLDGNGALDAELAYDDWLFAVRWARALFTFQVEPEFEQSHVLAVRHLTAYNAALNFRCIQRASGPMDDTLASPLRWAGLALARAHDLATRWSLATQANRLDLETLLNGLCVRVVIDPSRTFTGKSPGVTGTLHVPTAITILQDIDLSGPQRHDVP